MGACSIIQMSELDAQPDICERLACKATSIPFLHCNSQLLYSRLEFSYLSSVKRQACMGVYHTGTTEKTRTEAIAASI